MEALEERECTYDVEETKALKDTDIYNKLVKTGYIEKESQQYYKDWIRGT